jgi:hypothetical protein
MDSFAENINIEVSILNKPLIKKEKIGRWSLSESRIFEALL